MSENSTLTQIFKHDGALADAISGFSERAQQLEMALAIEAAIKGNKQLVAEAVLALVKPLPTLCQRCFQVVK